LRLHHFHELDRIAFLQARIGFDLGPDRGTGAALVVVGREDLGLGRKLQHDVEQAVEERRRVAAGQIRAACAADQERIAGKDSIVDGKTHGIPGMAGRVTRLEPQAAHAQDLPILEAKICKVAPVRTGA
jgi:hypothetical protein